MDSFDVIISPKALAQLNGYIDYIQYTLMNDQAAYNIWQDALDTRKKLSEVAGSLKFCVYPLPSCFFSKSGRLTLWKDLSVLKLKLCYAVAVFKLATSFSSKSILDFKLVICTSYINVLSATLID
ncbi:MAG: hypothetical protein NC429_05775 [Lachnospiraceae bacterium]|nr:hypothetical protein [Lachnospiraceae bacterium]